MTAGCWLVGPGQEASGCRTLEGLKAVLAHWWVKTGPGANASPLVGRVMSWGLVAGPWGVLALVPVHWCVGPGPGLSDGHGCVQGQLWAQGGLKSGSLLVDGAVSQPSYLLVLRHPNTCAYKLLCQCRDGSWG